MEKDSIAFHEDLSKVLSGKDAAAVGRILMEEREHLQDLQAVRMTVV